MQLNLYHNDFLKKVHTIRKYYCLFGVCSIASFLVIPNITLAEDNIDSFELSPEQLFSATIMSASRKEEKLWDAPAAIYVLNNDDIMRSGATSIPEVLRLVPGVNVARVNSSGWAISVRGFNNALANKLLVLIDGREVYDQLFSGVYWDIQDYPLEDIDRIEVIRGPGATLWGDNAVNGVINIITKTASETQGGLISLTSGNQERAISTARYGGKLGENGNYRVYGKYFNRAEEQTLVDTDANDDWEEGRGGFRTDWKGNENDDFTIQGDVYSSASHQFRNVSSFISPFSSLQVEDIVARGGNIRGNWERQLSGDSKFNVQTYIDYIYRDQSLLLDKRTSFNIDSQYELETRGMHKIITGAGYRFSNDDIDVSPIATFLTQRETDNVINGFIQDKITLQPDKWFLTLGSKFEYNDYSGVEIQPNARLQFHPNDKQMVWTSVSRAVRTPSRLEQDLDVAQVIGNIPPLVSIDTYYNPDLESEELIAYELGYRQQVRPDLSVDVATFYNDYSNLVTFAFQGTIAATDPTHTIFAFPPMNASSGHTYGIETTAEWDALDSLKLTASYSILHMDLHDNTTASLFVPASTVEDESPEQQFNIHSQWNLSNNLSLNNTLYYVGSIPAFGISDYWRFDTILSWDITDQVQFSLVGQNLFDDSHREFTSSGDANVTEIQRSIYGNITWRF